MKIAHVFVGVLAIMIIAGCAKSTRRSVELTDSKLVYHLGCTMNYGSPSPFGVVIKLKLPSGSFDKVLIVWIGDGEQLETKTVTFLTGRFDTIEVECRREEFANAKNKKVEISLLTGESVVEGPYLLEVPKPELEGLQ